jgi:hypothetical protein
MTPDKAWELWVEYCRKLKLYYDTTDVAVTEKPELEPWGMNPPPCVIVDASIAADLRIKRLEEAVEWAAMRGTWLRLYAPPEGNWEFTFANELRRRAGR